jgi:LemA protein
MESYKQPWYTTKKAINGYIIAGVILVLSLVVFSTFGGVNNTYVGLSQNVKTSQSNISKESQRRVDLFNNLVDAIQSYNKFEQSTLTQLTKARSQANSGKVESAQLTIQAVVEAYPQLKSQDNYKQAMTEFSITENRLAAYREQYNNDVRSFNSYVQGFPQTIFLSMLSKDKTEKPFLDYKVNDADARNLFKAE